MNKCNELKVGGRLKESGLSNPNLAILLPDNTITRVIIQEFHSRAHVGVEWTLSLVRQYYWIVHGRSVVRKIVRSCIACKKLFSKPSKQIVADLPLKRLDPGKPPFTFVGIDVFDPCSVKVNRLGIKRYGCMFT